MLKKTISSIKAITGYLLLGLNTLLIAALFFPAAMLKKISNNQIINKYSLMYLHKVGKLWIIINYLIVKLVASIKWDVEGLNTVDNLPKNKWYLMISNHQSWNDVLILQFLLNSKLPFQKYLVKENMRKFPVMGFVWEALDCPFLKRSSNNDDIEIIKNKCKKFKLAPATIAAFIEGTRFTKEKHKQQSSPYLNLLKPKAGGMAAILEELHHEIKGIIDVSLCYSPRKLSFWDLFAGNINKITARVNYIDIPQWLLEKYHNKVNYDSYKEEFHEWINSIWLAKDKFLSKVY
jgi:1-acyl-sn-glycerol-3-phosphate acyltransferase